MPIVPDQSKPTSSPVRKPRTKQVKKHKKTGLPPYSTLSHIDAYTIGFALSLRNVSGQGSKRTRRRRRRKLSASAESGGDSAAEESGSDEEELMECEKPACLRVQDAYNDALERNLERTKILQHMSQQLAEMATNQARAETNQEHLKEVHKTLEVDIKHSAAEEKELKAKLHVVLQEKEELNRKLDAVLKEKQRLRMRANGLMRNGQDPYADMKPVEIVFNSSSSERDLAHRHRSQASRQEPPSFTVELASSDWRHPPVGQHKPRSCWNAIEGCLESSQQLPPRHGFAQKLRREARQQRPRSALGLSRSASESQFAPGDSQRVLQHAGQQRGKMFSSPFDVRRRAPAAPRGKFIRPVSAGGAAQQQRAHHYQQLHPRPWQ